MDLTAQEEMLVEPNRPAHTSLPLRRSETRGSKTKGRGSRALYEPSHRGCGTCGPATNGDLDVVIAAILHDTVEDTDTTIDELRAAFGSRIADLTAEVTDDKSLPKQTRKDLQIEHAAHASWGAQVIKLADKTSNLRSLLSSPPPDWSRARRDEYVDWARRVVAGCRGANVWLAEQFDEAARALG
jgi:hypothetical protein